MKLLKSPAGLALLILYYTIFGISIFILIIFIMLRIGFLAGMGAGLVLGILCGLLGGKLEYNEHINLLKKRCLRKREIK